MVTADTALAEELGHGATAWQGKKSRLSTQPLLLMDMGSWHFWIAGFSGTQSRIYEAKTKPRELPAMVFLWFRGPHSDFCTLF